MIARSGMRMSTSRPTEHSIGTHGWRHSSFRAAIEKLKQNEKEVSEYRESLFFRNFLPAEMLFILHQLPSGRELQAERGLDFRRSEYPCRVPD